MTVKNTGTCKCLGWFHGDVSHWCPIHATYDKLTPRVRNECIDKLRQVIANAEAQIERLSKPVSCKPHLLD